MKKWMYILLSVLVLGVFLYFSVDIKTNSGCPPPEKPKGVPESAIWSGGCDGGNWIELVGIKGDRYRFRIYQDWDGELKMDADFEFDGNSYDLNNTNWSNLVCCYTQSLDAEVVLTVVLEKKEENTYYKLKSVYPAYGGDDWEIIKEKYNL